MRSFTIHKIDLYKEPWWIFYGSTYGITRHESPLGFLLRVRLSLEQILRFLHLHAQLASNSLLY